MIKLYEKIAASGLLEGGSGIAWVNLVHIWAISETRTERKLSPVVINILTEVFQGTVPSKLLVLFP